MRPVIETELARSPTGSHKFKKTNTVQQKSKLVQRYAALFRNRQRWLDIWKDIRDNELPYDGQFDDDQPGKPNLHDDNIYNTTPGDCRSIFAAGIQSGLTPPSRKWFRYTLADMTLNDNVMVKRVLDQRCDITEYVLARSNFYNAVHTVYMELPMGQAPMGIFAAGRGITFVPYTIGTYALGTNAQGIVNTFARKVRMTAAQIVGKFGLENCPQSVQDVYRSNNGYSTYFTVCWLVEENDKADGDELGNQHMPFRSVYWVEGSNDQEVLAATGFEEWAIPVARYDVKGLEEYGIGPAWYALPDSRMLQKMEYDAAMATELGIKPPMQGPADIAHRINLFPGGYTANLDPNNAVRPLFQGQLDIGTLDQKIVRVEDRIKRAYSTDLFLMLDQLDRGQMTAQEVMARNQEKLQQLGPVVERLQSEFLNKVLERVYNILDRNQVFPPLPDKVQELLDGQEIKIEYLSPLAQAQKMSGLTAIEQGLAFVGQTAQLDPRVVNRVDFSDAVAKYLDRIGVPATMVRSEDEYQQILEAQQKAEQEAQQQALAAQQAQQAAPLAQAAKNLTDAANDGNPALREWMGMET
ncbi:head-tail connector protein [Megasphaera elsdenii]|uniref:portal protein n=1 Tax=Megasphaera elsdenii TaxID=907 RepID=UPI001D01A9F3|nr:portal protein [Megasphaera elsdenii]MCB5701396.1 head-tail connector protein [Megasphaera elsdenii]MCB5726155.1 head-tail connector protein [Megasphaera elsdenii]MCB5770122.1 head-tail connector protein [Megasphaera elsdenii]DAI15121.1 MAG TPA: head to tail connecting protein [Caudoviricetes sp.]